MKATFTIAEIAERWSCSPSTVLEHVRSGRLRAINVSSSARRQCYRVPKASLEAFERDRSTDRPAEPKPTTTPRRVPKLAPHELTWT